jgi:FkbM family methyltransferase
LGADYLVNGIAMDLDLGEAIQRQMATGSYEPEQTEWVRRHIGPESVFVDVGANFGWYTTLALSLVGLRGRVFAFEPSPVAFSSLKRAIDRSVHRNATLVNAAVGRETGNIIIYLPKGGPVHSPSAFKSPGKFEPLAVPLIALDEFQPLADIPRIDMIKIDVEGSEPDVVEGMTSLVASGRVRYVLCEFNSWWLNANGTTVESLAARFHEMGFAVEESTKWARGPASGGGTFDLQDVLYRCIKN